MHGSGYTDYFQGCSLLILQHLIGKRILMIYKGSLLDIVSCQSMSDLQISNRFEKLGSFLIEINKNFLSKPLFRGRAFALKFGRFLHYSKRESLFILLFLLHGQVLAHYRKIELYLNKQCSLLGQCKSLGQMRDP